MPRETISSCSPTLQQPRCFKNPPRLPVVIVTLAIVLSLWPATVYPQSSDSDGQHSGLPPSQLMVDDIVLTFARVDNTSVRICWKSNQNKSRRTGHPKRLSRIRSKQQNVVAKIQPENSKHFFEVRLAQRSPGVVIGGVGPDTSLRVIVAQGQEILLNDSIAVDNQGPTFSEWSNKPLNISGYPNSELVQYDEDDNDDGRDDLLKPWPPVHGEVIYSSARVEEISIMCFIMVLWIGAIILFVHRWGKIRMLVPHQPRYDYAQAQANAEKLKVLPPSRSRSNLATSTLDLETAPPGVLGTALMQHQLRRGRHHHHRYLYFNRSVDHAFSPRAGTPADDNPANRFRSVGNEEHHPDKLGTAISNSNFLKPRSIYGGYLRPTDNFFGDNETRKTRSELDLRCWPVRNHSESLDSRETSLKEIQNQPLDVVITPCSSPPQPSTSVTQFIAENSHEDRLANADDIVIDITTSETRSEHKKRQARLERCSPASETSEKDTVVVTRAQVNGGHKATEV